MKIRTDFVTNSSSSSFILTLTIVDKNDNVYCFEGSPAESEDYGGTIKFQSTLKRLTFEGWFYGIDEWCRGSHELSGCQYEGRNDRIERVKSGDEVSFRLCKDIGLYDVYNSEGSLGYIADAGTRELLNHEGVHISGIVTDVLPLSKRSSRCKKALICVKPIISFSPNVGKIRFSDVKSLCDYLVSSIKTDYEEYGDELDGYQKRHQLELKKNKSKFVKDVTSKISDIHEIKKITVKHVYSGWGEDADLIPENDAKLKELASLVVNATGEEENQAKKAMIDYINTPDPSRGGENFGVGDVYYTWNDSVDINRIANTLCTDHCLHETYEGFEYSEIDIQSGNVIEFSEFNLAENRPFNVDEDILNILSWISKRQAFCSESDKNDDPTNIERKPSHKDWDFILSSNNEAILTSYKGAETEVIIPEKIGDWIVTGLVGTFEYCGNIKSVTLPKRLLKIGDNSFKNCRSLQNIEIPTGVTSIGKSAFSECSGLKSIIIPESIKEIESMAFYKCESLESITFSNGLVSIGDYSFANLKLITNITLPDTVEKIGDYAFDSLRKMTHIVLPKNLRNFGRYVFANCTHLTKIEIPEGVFSVNSGLFYNCSNLTEVIIGKGTQSISHEAFKGCKRIDRIVMTENIKDISSIAFYELSHQFKIYAPSGSYAEKYAEKHGISFVAK